MREIFCEKSKKACEKVRFPLTSMRHFQTKSIKVKVKFL